MDLSNILAPDRTVCGLKKSSKKQLLEYIAELASRYYPKLSLQDIYQALDARERLGSTNLGSGIAIPHCRLPQITSIYGIFITLYKPIKYDETPESEPIDVVFALFVPNDMVDEHIQTLAAIANQLKKSTLCQQLRQCTNHYRLYELITKNEQ